MRTTASRWQWDPVQTYHFTTGLTLRDVLGEPRVERADHVRHVGVCLGNAVELGEGHSERELRAAVRRKHVQRSALSLSLWRWRLMHAAAVPRLVPTERASRELEQSLRIVLLSRSSATSSLVSATCPKAVDSPSRKRERERVCVCTAWTSHGTHLPFLVERPDLVKRLLRAAHAAHQSLIAVPAREKDLLVGRLVLSRLRCCCCCAAG